MSPESWSAVGGCASAVAAAISLLITWRGLNFQNETLTETKKRNIQDLLSAHALRANTSTLGQDASQWSFSQFANVMFAIDSARKIVNSLNEKSGISQGDAREYFINQLEHQIISALNNNCPPDGAFQPKGTIQEAIKVVQLWNPNAHFLGFTHVNFIIS